MEQSDNTDYYSKNRSMGSNSRITHQIKIILLGDIAVGKTSLFARYLDNTFSEEYRCTINIEFKAKSIALNNMTTAQIEVWDTCGEEKYRSLTRQYYRKSQGIILLFDLTNRNSFTNLSSWLNDISSNSEPDCQKIIVGNKTDLEEERKVTTKEAENFAINNGFNYLEVSAKNGMNVEPLFEKLAGSIAKILEEKMTKEKKEKDHETLLKNQELEQRLRDQDRKKARCCK